jgi:hypothetical protein
MNQLKEIAKQVSMFMQAELACPGIIHKYASNAIELNDKKQREEAINTALKNALQSED